MKHRFYLLSFGIGAMLLATDFAFAQSANCGDHAAVVARLAERYGESRQAMGLGANNAVLEVFASESGSWTITVTTAGGPTCLVAAGQNFQIIAEDLPGQDKGA
jgi:hypothetical protein